MIHSEVVLESNCSECLGSSLHSDILLGLDCLMQSVTPSSALHDTAGLLIDNLHLAVLGDDIIHVLFEHRICLQELDHCVYTLVLESVILHESILLLMLFSLGKTALFNVSQH